MLGRWAHLPIELPFAFRLSREFLYPGAIFWKNLKTVSELAHRIEIVAMVIVNLSQFLGNRKSTSQLTHGIGNGCHGD